MRKLQGRSSGRISELPDGVLDSILCLLPKKYAMRTSILSKRWTHLWKSTWIHATSFDFGEEFAQAQTQEQFAATVNKYLHLHNRHNIDNFRLYFNPGARYRADVEKWIEFATSKGVMELHLTLCCVTENSFAILSSCNSFIKLTLSKIIFNPSSDFTGFGSLQTLLLNQVSITDDALDNLITNCPALINLCLKMCSGLVSIKVSSISLRCLSVIVTNAYEIDIFAPNLKSLHFYGDIFYGYNAYVYQNVAALEDFFVSAIGYDHTEPEHDFIHILSGASHVKTLTTCIGGPMFITLAEEVNLGPLPVTLPNLIELQILIGGQIGEEYLGHVFMFFKHTVCPFVEKIFIDLSGSYLPPPEDNVEEAEVPLSCVFSNLKTVKINQFQGIDAEMKLVKFFLQRANALELLVLVAAPCFPPGEDKNSVRDGHPETSEKSMKLLVDELVILPKLSDASHVKIITTCIAAPMHITRAEEFDLAPLPIGLPNLQELQILIGFQLEEEYLGIVFNFFKHTVCPSLEKIFIDLPVTYIPLPLPLQPYNVEEAEMPLGCVFSNLKTVKINQFRGTDSEMKLVKFFLQRASALELLVLVAASSFPPREDTNSVRDGDRSCHSETSEKSMKLLVDELTRLHKSSTNVQILLFDHGEVDTSFTPVHRHTDYYLDYVNDVLST